MDTYSEEQTVSRTETADPWATNTRTVVTRRGSAGALAERLMLFSFGLVQGLIALRILLLLVAAREGNAIVGVIYGISDVFVMPFRGMLRIDEIAAGHSALDVGAIVALAGLTIIELAIIALVRVFRPAPAA